MTTQILLVFFYVQIVVYEIVSSTEFLLNEKYLGSTTAA